MDDPRYAFLAVIKNPDGIPLYALTSDELDDLVSAIDEVLNMLDVSEDITDELYEKFAPFEYPPEELNPSMKKVVIDVDDYTVVVYGVLYDGANVDDL